MSPQEAFKFGFYARCAEEGLTSEQTLARIKTASLGTIAGELIEGPFRLMSHMGPAAAQAALVAGIGLPIAGGLAMGYAGAKATDDDSNIEEAKADEILSEYQRLTDHARRQALVKQMRGQSTLSLQPQPMKMASTF